MTMGETRVDLLHLLEDLRDAYPESIEETFITEAVANALDSGATAIHLTTDIAAAALTIHDNGSGMHRRELARYHDLAASTKTRGSGIGFAGVGIKLGLLLAREVHTETRRGEAHVSTAWALATKLRAPWRWVPPAGLVTERGTAVTVVLHNPLSPLLDPGFLDQALRRHFAPMFLAEFAEVLRTRYPTGVQFTVNGARLGGDQPPPGELAPIALRLARKRKPSAAGWLVRSPTPLAEEAQGIAISTLGKVIKRGWDWLGLRPSRSEYLTGLIEVPALAECLTLNKADFIRTGPRGALYLAYRKAIQEALGPHLAKWGAAGDVEAEPRRPAARPVERDVQRILAELADRFPLLLALVERRPGGQRRLPLDGGPPEAAPLDLMTDSPPGDQEPPGPEGASASPESPPEPRLPQPPPGCHVSGPKRPARLGLTISFAHEGESADLARLVDTAVMVNADHPAYRRAVSSRSEGYHLALAVALALAPLVTEAVSEREFLNRFLAEWGSSVGGRSRSRPTGRRAPDRR